MDRGCVRAVVYLLIFLSLLTSTAARVAAQAPIDGRADPSRLPRDLIVLLDDGPVAPTAEEVVAKAKVKQRLPGGLGEGGPQEVRLLIPEADRRASGKGRAEGRLLRYVVMSYPLPANVEKVKAALEMNPNVLWVDYNWPAEASASPNDPLFTVQSDPALYQWGLHALHLPEAWDYNKGHAYVGVVDYGLDTTHPDLKTYSFDGSGNLQSVGAYRPQLSFDYGYPTDTCSAAQSTDCSGVATIGCVDERQAQMVGSACQGPVQRGGHGTHVAGIVAATANNSERGDRHVLVLQPPHQQDQPSRLRRQRMEERQ